MVWNDAKRKAAADSVADQTDDDVEINFSGNNYKDIAMMQLKKLILLSNVEFRGGYYTNYQTKGGENKEVYVQDSREAFSNGVYVFALLLRPRFNDKMRASFTKFKEKISMIEKSFMDATKVEEEVILGESFYTTEEDKILLETFRNKKLTLFLALFSELSCLLAKLNYLDIAGGIY